MACDEKWSTAKKVNCRVLIPLAVGIILVIVITSAITLSRVPEHANVIKAELTTSELSNIAGRSHIISREAELTFGKAINFITLVANYSNKVFQDQFNFSQPYESFYAGGGSHEKTPPNFAYDATFNIESSTYGAAYFIKNINSYITDPSFLSLLNTSSNIDNAFNASFQSTNDYFGLYMGFESNGLWRSWPYFRLRGHSTLQYNCQPANTPTVGYDPRCRGWYAIAKAEPRDIYTLTEPYNDATTNALMITISKKVYGTGNTFLGVVGIDLLMSTLSNKIITSTILQNGYTFMVDNQRNIVVYPGKTDDQIQAITEREFPGGVVSEITAFNTIMNTMISTNTPATVTYQKNGETWYISYNHVAGTPYYVAVVVPRTDILRPANELESAVTNIYIVYIVVCIIVLGATVIFASCFTTKHVSRIVKPLKEAGEQLEKMSKFNYDVVTESQPSVAAEVDEACEGIQSLILAVQNGNTQFMEGDLNRALKSYEACLLLMQKMKNKKGEGICLNNIGNAHQRLNPQSEDAKIWYKKAINNAKELLAFYMKDQDNNKDTISALKVVLANRYMNYAVHLEGRGATADAIKIFNKSLELHRAYDNFLGVSKASGNLGLLYLKMGDTNTAQKLIDDAFELAYGHSNLISSIPIQYAAMYKGMFYLEMDNMKDAILWFNFTVDRYQEIDRYILMKCAECMKQIYQREGRLDYVQQIDQMSLGVNTTGNRFISFINDYSGSMRGMRNATCNECVINIVNNDLKDNDHVTYYLFNDRVIPVLNQYVDVGHNRAYIIDQIRKYVMPTSRTAFFAALRKSMENQVVLKNDNKWIVALTDGEDNCSTNTDVKVIETIMKSGHKINLIIITVGNSYDGKLISSILSLNRKMQNKGIHLQAGGDANSISEAFTQASKIMASQLNVESF